MVFSKFRDGILSHRKTLTRVASLPLNFIPRTGVLNLCPIAALNGSIQAESLGTSPFACLSVTSFSDCLPHLKTRIDPAIVLVCSAYLVLSGPSLPSRFNQPVLDPVMLSWRQGHLAGVSKDSPSSLRFNIISLLNADTFDYVYSRANGSRGLERASGLSS